MPVSCMVSQALPVTSTAGNQLSVVWCAQVQFVCFCVWLVVDQRMRFWAQTGFNSTHVGSWVPTRIITFIWLHFYYIRPYCCSCVVSHTHCPWGTKCNPQLSMLLRCTAAQCSRFCTSPALLCSSAWPLSVRIALPAWHAVLSCLHG